MAIYGSAASILCIVFFVCDFPLFLCYSWFLPDIYTFVHIPIRRFPGIKEVFFYLPICSIFLFAIPNFNVVFVCYVICHVAHFLDIFVVFSD